MVLIVNALLSTRKITGRQQLAKAIQNQLDATRIGSIAAVEAYLTPQAFQSTQELLAFPSELQQSLSCSNLIGGVIDAIFDPKSPELVRRDACFVRLYLDATESVRTFHISSSTGSSGSLKSVGRWPRGYSSSSINQDEVSQQPSGSWNSSIIKKLRDQQQASTPTVESLPFDKIPANTHVQVITSDLLPSSNIMRQLESAAHLKQCSVSGLVGAWTPFVTGKQFTLFHGSEIIENGCVGIALSSTAPHSDCKTVHPNLDYIGEKMSISKAQGNIVMQVNNGDLPARFLADKLSSTFKPNDLLYAKLIDDNGNETLSKIIAGDPANGHIALEQFIDLPVTSNKFWTIQFGLISSTVSPTNLELKPLFIGNLTEDTPARYKTHKNSLGLLSETGIISELEIGQQGQLVIDRIPGALRQPLLQ